MEVAFEFFVLHGQLRDLISDLSILADDVQEEVETLIINPIQNKVGWMQFDYRLFVIIYQLDFKCEYNCLVFCVTNLGKLAVFQIVGEL